MTTPNDLLDHAVELFPAPDGALPELHRLHRRRQSNRKLGAGALGLVIALLIATAALHVTRSATHVPASPSVPALTTFTVSPNVAGIAAGHGALWVIDYHQVLLLRLDPVSGQIVDSIRMNNETINGLPEAVDVTDEAVIVTMWNGGQDNWFEVIDPSTDHVVATFEIRGAHLVGEELGSVWFEGPNRWVGSRGFGQRLFRVDPATWTLDPRPGPSIRWLQNLTVGAGGIWAQDAGDIVRVNPKDGHLSNVIFFPHSMQELIAADGRLWAVPTCWQPCPGAPYAPRVFWTGATTPSQSGWVFLGPLPGIDVHTGRTEGITRQVRLLASDARGLWIMASDSLGRVARVVRVDFATGQVGYSEPVPVVSRASADGRFLWLLDPGDHGAGRLIRIDSTQLRSTTG